MFYRRKRNVLPKPTLRSLWISFYEILRSRLSDVWTPCVATLLCCLTPYLCPFPLRFIYYLSRVYLITGKRSAQQLSKNDFGSRFSAIACHFWEAVGRTFTVVLKVLHVINNMQSRIYIIKRHDMYACSDFLDLFQCFDGDFCTCFFTAFFYAV